MSTWKDGLKLFIPHFVGWTLPIYFAVYFCDSLGVTFLRTIFIELTVASAVLYMTMLAESMEWKDGKQTRGKLYIDRTAKVGGIIASLLTAGWWREFI